MTDWVYGQDSYHNADLWIVLPEDRAKYWAAVSRAVKSGHWAELRKAVGEDKWATMFDEPPGDDAHMELDDVPGHADGDFPPMPGQMMLDCLPDEVVDAWVSSEELVAEIVTTTLNGDRLDLYDIDRALADLQAKGYSLRRDDDLIEEVDSSYW